MTIAILQSTVDAARFMFWL